MSDTPTYDELSAQAAQIEAMKEKCDKFMWQVRDTCARAEKAEAALEEERRLTGELETQLAIARAELRAITIGKAEK